MPSLHLNVEHQQYVVARHSSTLYQALAQQQLTAWRNKPGQQNIWGLDVEVDDFFRELVEVGQAPSHISHNTPAPARKPKNRPASPSVDELSTYPHQHAGRQVFPTIPSISKRTLEDAYLDS